MSRSAKILELARQEFNKTDSFRNVTQENSCDKQEDNVVIFDGYIVPNETFIKSPLLLEPTDNLAETRAGNSSNISQITDMENYLNNVQNNSLNLEKMECGETVNVKSVENNSQDFENTNILSESEKATGNVFCSSNVLIITENGNLNLEEMEYTSEVENVHSNENKSEHFENTNLLSVNNEKGAVENHSLNLENMEYKEAEITKLVENNAVDFEEAILICEETENIKTRTRKRVRNEAQWRRNEIRTKRNRGESYINWRNKEVQKRSLRKGCSGCRLQCHTKFSSDHRMTLLKSYWEIGDVNRQRDFIYRHISVKPPRRVRLRKSKILTEIDHNNQSETTKDTKRKHAVSYFLPCGNNLERVCQTFFLDTLSISNQVVKTTIKKADPVVGSIIKKDMRGKNMCTTKLPRAVEESVMAHINSFDKIESHYCRRDSKKQYLPSTLNIKKMYLLYLEFCKERQIKTTAKESMYRHIFCTKFNLSFFKPKKDLCSLCDKFKNANDVEKQNMQQELEIHNFNKNAARSLKNGDKEKAKNYATFCAAVYDLQQVLQCPKTDNSLLFYKSKLAAYNLTVYELGNNTGHCYMWNETIAHRGCAEIGTCVFKFIEMKKDQGVTEFSFFSDNCCGQNRNQFVFEKGHTQNEGDSVHSTIERHSMHIPVYIPSQWYTIARTACRKKPYTVTELTNFYDLKKLTTETTNNMQKIKLSQVKSIIFERKKPVKIKYDFSQDFEEIDVIGKRRKKKQIEGYKLSDLYSEKIPISTKKFTGLKYLCQQRAIPEEYHEFFLNLKHAAMKKSDEDY